MLWGAGVAHAQSLPANPGDASPASEPADEIWNLHAQTTLIVHHKAAFAAAYTNANGSPNSLRPEAENTYTATATLFAGVRPWRNGEIYLVPELISEHPLSRLHGLGGSIQNAELEKNGVAFPSVYRSRLFLRQTWNFGGAAGRQESGAMLLGKSLTERRFVLTVGNTAVIDIFDRGTYAGDVRMQFMSMNFLTHAAYDFAADARGYSWGVAGEFLFDSWAVRAGRFIAPKDPNQLALDFRIWKNYGDQLEFEHRHVFHGLPGKVRVVGYRNREVMGRWDDAVSAWRMDPARIATTCAGFSYESENAGAPDLCWARRSNVKMGAGLTIEQALSDEIGAFAKGMISDGNTEVYSYTSADSSWSLGLVSTGRRWRRSFDSAGVGYAQNAISESHATYLGLGGVDGFIGDGGIRRAPERAFEIYYNLSVTRWSWIALDYQRVANPGYNADRGPVNLFGGRVRLAL